MAFAPDKVEVFTISSKGGRVDFTPQGGYVLQWVVYPDTNVFYQGSVLERTGIPPLVPGFKDNIPNLRRHGPGKDSLWTHEIIPPNHAKLSVNSNDWVLEKGESYPKGVEFGIDLIIQNDGGLDYRLSAVNRGNENALMNPSLHPYFAVKHEKKGLLRFMGDPKLVNSRFDWGLESPDNTYSFRELMGIKYPDGKILEIRDTTPLRPGFNRAQLWSQNPKEDPNNHSFVCYEPLGMVRTLLPGQSMETSLRFSMIHPGPSPGG